MFTCHSMRAAVLLSAGLLLSGVLLGVLVFAVPLALPIAQLALLLVLAGALVLSVTFLVALIPSVAHQLDECQH